MSACTSCSCSTIGTPPTSSSSSGERVPKIESADRVGDVDPGDPVDPPQRDVGELADLQRAEVVLPAEHAGAAHRRHREHLPGAHRCRSAAQPGDQQRLVQFVVHPTRLVGGRPVDAESRPALRPRACRRPARSRSRAGRSRSGSARPRCRWRRTGRCPAVVGQTTCANQTSGPEPAQILDVLAGLAAVLLQAERLLVERLAEVGVHPGAVRAGDLGGAGHQFAGHRERRAGRDGDLQHGIR